MKSIKRQLLKVIIVIGVLNLFGFFIASYLTIDSLTAYQQTDEAMTETASEIISSNGQEITLQDEYYDYIDSNVTSDTNYYDMIVDPGSLKQDMTVCHDRECYQTNYGIFRARLLAPTVAYAVVLVFSLIYGIVKIRRILREVTDFQGQIEQNIANREVINNDYHYQELQAIGDAIDDGIRAEQKALRLERELVTFTMHDLKTPLQVAFAYTELAQMDTEQSPYLSKVSSSLTDINRVITSELEPFILIDIDIYYFIDQLIGDYQKVYPDVEFTLNGIEGRMWSVNSSRFKRILTNIIDNSINHLERDNQIVITVTDSKIIIADSGTGLTDTHYGTGHGLDIIAKYCKLHNFTFTLENDPSGGAVATVEKIM